MDIAAIRDRLSFIQGDGLEILGQFATSKDTVFFIDPPYTVAGKKSGNRLYTCNEINHEALFVLADSLVGNFLMTYDNHEAVQQMADRFGFETYPVAMKNTHHAKMTELLIGKNLAWLKD